MSERKIVRADGEKAHPIPYGAESRWDAMDDGMADGQCHDCGAHQGEIHMAGCDMEECPFCGGQYLACGCSTNENEYRLYEEPPDDGHLVTDTERELLRDFLVTDFDSVERDGLMVSRGADEISMHEAHGIGVPEGNPKWSTHDYELLWHASVAEVREEIDLAGGDSQ